MEICLALNSPPQDLHFNVCRLTFFRQVNIEDDLLLGFGCCNFLFEQGGCHDDQRKTDPEQDQSGDQPAA